MKVAVITPYYKESPEVLKRCMDSVANQTHADIIHVMVADGYPSRYVINRAEGNTKIMHIVIPNCGDYGDTPRAIGAAVIACRKEYDAVAFLDADNWYEPDHIEEALKHMSKPIVTTGRNLRRVDGSLLAPCPESDGVNFCDTNCYVIHRNAFGVIGRWTYKENKYGIVGDRMFWQSLPKEHVARSPKHTVNYTTKFAVHYLHFKEKPPLDAIEFKNGLDGLPVAHRYYQS
jgi:glycosyltransferase involved in cell wall biosynthesis